MCVCVCLSVLGCGVASGTLFGGWHLSWGFGVGEQEVSNSSSPTFSWLGTICPLLGSDRDSLWWPGPGLSFRTVCSLPAAWGEQEKGGSLQRQCDKAGSRLWEGCRAVSPSVIKSYETAFQIIILGKFFT